MFLFRLTTRATLLMFILFCLNACDKQLDESHNVHPAAITTSDSSSVFIIEQAFPGQTGIPKKGELFGQTISYKDINGEAVFQGDILLSPEQLAVITDSAGSANGRISGAGLADKFKRWRSFIIPYTIDPALPNKARVTDAIAHWESKTPLRFVMRTSQSDYITFRPSSGCSSKLGRIGGQQFINLGTGCNTGTAIHEIGHAVGLLHEQARTNRDSHISVKYDNILQTEWDQFDKYQLSTTPGFDFREFDFNSIMLYAPFNTYAINQSKPTMTRKDGSTWTPNRSSLSAGDIKTVTSMYANLYIIWNKYLYAVNVKDGSYAAIDNTWSGFNAKFIAEDDAYLWAINGETLWRVDRLSGKFKSFGSGWSGAMGVTGIVNGNTRWAIQGTNLYAINAQGQRFKVTNRNWNSAQAILAHKDYVFVVRSDNRLVRVDLNTPEPKVVRDLGGGWSNVKAIAVSRASSNEVYIIRGSSLYRVNIDTGNAVVVGLSQWAGTEGMAGIDGKLYIVAGGILWEVDENGNRRSLGGGWSGTQSMGVVRNANVL